MIHERDHPEAAAPARTAEESDLVRVWGACRRRWRTLLLAMLFVLLPSLVWVLMSPPLFEARLELLVKSARLESLRGRDPATETALQAELGTEIGVLRSRGVLERVAVESHLVEREAMGEPGDARLARAVRRLERELDIEALPKTNLISVRYADRDAHVAADVLLLLASSYLEKHMTLHRDPKAVGFFDAQVEELSQALQTATTRLDTFKGQHGITLLDIQKELNLRRVDELRTEVGRLDADVRSREEMVALLDGRRSKRPFESLEKEFLRQEAELIGARTRRDALRTAMTTLQAEQQALEAATSEYEDLTREVQSAQNKLAVYRTRMDEERIENLLDRERILEVAVVDPPSPPALPVDRHSAITLALGFCLASLTGIGAALLADRTTRQPADAKGSNEEIPGIALETPQPLPSSD